jgi:hypothetical protein
MCRGRRGVGRCAARQQRRSEPDSGHLTPYHDQRTAGRADAIDAQGVAARSAYPSHHVASRHNETRAGPHERRAGSDERHAGHDERRAAAEADERAGRPSRAGAAVVLRHE